ncbi:MAG: hypothetical protein ACLQPH_07825 [Acidimicrobiales bacterium]
MPSLWPEQGNAVEIAGTTFDVKQVKVVRENDAVLLAHLHEMSDGSPTIIVADRISEAARTELSRAGLAWLDRRGHLWIRTEGLFVNAEVAPVIVTPSRRVIQALGGTGMDVALALLADPAEPHGVHQLARVINRSPGRVSEILTELRSQGLVGNENRPFVPELFWAIAEEWAPRWIPMPEAPPPEPPDRYRLSGTLGAVALEAPLVVGTARTWPRLYVADDTDLATVLGAYGARSGWTGSEIAVCPSRFGFTWGSGIHRNGFVVANHLVVALDLAQDRARGREILESWNPQDVPRVW